MLQLLTAPPRPTRRSLARAAQTVVERLEDRQFLSGTLTVTNPFTLPGNSNLIFNQIGNKNTYTPANVVHSQQTLNLRNTGTTTLTISSMTLSGPFAFVTGSGNLTTLGTLTIAPATTTSLTIAFTQSSVPPHSTNETNYTDHTNGGASIGGTLTINSDDPATPTKTVSLAGYYQQVSNNNEEPALPTIINKLAGYQTNLGLATGSVDFNQGASAAGSEVLAPNGWVAASSAGVHVQQLAAFHTQGNSAALYWYTGTATTTQSSHLLFVATPAQGQTVLPSVGDTGGGALRGDFTPTGAFGLRVDNEYSDDAINVAAGNKDGGGHHFRFWPLIDQSGNTVANTYIVAMDYGTAQVANHDFNDNVYVVSNIRPVGTPDTPTNLTVTNGASPTLSWTASTYSPVAYRVYRSSTANGTYTLLTTNPVTTTTYTDSTLGSATTAYYRVTAIDSSAATTESAPATAVANPGPVVSNFAFGATAGTAQTFNALANATDASGTILPNTLALSATPNHGGTATANSDGTITYTPAASYSGTETLQYTVADSNGVRSAAGTVTFTVSNGATTPTDSTTPTFNNMVANTLVNTPITLNLLSTQTSNVALAASGAVTLVNASGATSHGNVTVNADGTAVYTPGDGFIGGDSFTYRVTSAAGVTSAVINVDINTGVQIGTGVAYKTLTFTDVTGTAVTVSLNRGTANIYFDGNGVYTLPAKGKPLTVSGGVSNALHIRTMTLTGTTAASVLAIKGAKNGAVTLGGISATSPIGTISAKTANLVTNGGASIPVLGNALPAGYMSLSGVRSLTLASANNATISLGSGVPSSAVTFAGSVVNTVFSSGGAISKLSAANWNASSGTTPGPISAASINNLKVPGQFGADVTVNGNLGSAAVGTVTNGVWTVTGNAKSVAMNSVATTFGGLSVTGALNNFTVKTGNLASDVSAGSIGNLKVTGTMSGNVHTGGNLNSMTVGTLVNSLVTVGTTDTLATAATGSIGTSVLKNLKVTAGKNVTNAFSNSQVIANTINSVTTGRVDVTATAGSEGVAASTIKSATVNANGSVIKLNAKALASDASLASYLQSKNFTYSPFEIDIVTAAAG